MLEEKFSNTALLSLNLKFKEYRLLWYLARGLPSQVRISKNFRSRRTSPHWDELGRVLVNVLGVMIDNANKVDDCGRANSSGTRSRSAASNGPAALHAVGTL